MKLRLLAAVAAALATVALTAGAASASPVAVSPLSCSARVSNAHPQDYTTVIVYVATSGNRAAKVTTTASYRTTTAVRHTTDPQPGKVSYYISDATLGYQVKIQALVQSGSQSGRCTTSFTPQRKPGPLPVIYDSPNGGWSQAQVKPPWVLINMSGSPRAHTWHWNTWNSTTAKSTGTLWVNNCIPDCAQGKEGYHHLYVTLSGVKYHNGRAYYSVMTWYTPGYRVFGSPSSTVVLHFGVLPGATVPGWH